MVTMTPGRIEHIIRSVWRAAFGDRAFIPGDDVRVENGGFDDENYSWDGWELFKPDGVDFTRWTLYRGVAIAGTWNDPPDYDIVEVGQYDDPLSALRAAVSMQALELADGCISALLEAIEMAEVQELDGLDGRV